MSTSAAPIAFDAKTLADSKRAATTTRTVRIDPTDRPDLGTQESMFADAEMPKVPPLLPPSAMEFRDGAGEADYVISRDMHENADAMIETYQELGHLSGVKIVYLWKREGGKKGGKLKLGECKKVSGLEKFYAESDFVIWLATDHSKTLQMTPKQLEALLYHELCHATYEESEDGEATMKVRLHDLEMFEDEVKRYGLWTSELKSAKDLFAQAPLPGLGKSVPYGSAA